MPFRDPIVAGEELMVPGIRSEDYAEGTKGWRFGREGKSQATNLQVLGDLGVEGDSSADSFHVGPSGLWLPDDSEVGQRFTDLEDRTSPNGYRMPYMVYQGAVVTATDFGPLPATGESLLGDMQIYEIAGHLYLMDYEGCMSGDVVGDKVSLHTRYTRDGTRPVAASAALGYAADLRINVAGDLVWFRHYRVWSGAPTAPNPMRIGLFARRTSGTGVNVVVKTRFTYQCPRIIVWDMGSGLGGTMNLGTDPDVVAAPDPVTRSTVYNPTWSRTYEGNGDTTWDDSAYCYQGYYSPNPARGNTKSLVGFDYAKIKADLAGATVNSVKLTFKVAHSYYGTGLTAIIGGHNYTTKPAICNLGNVAENQYSRASSVAGSTYTVTLPSSFGTNLKSGTWTGIAFGPGPALQLGYYGYMYGATQTGKPYLTISYTK